MKNVWKNSLFPTNQQSNINIFSPDKRKRKSISSGQMVAEDDVTFVQKIMIKYLKLLWLVILPMSGFSI